MSRVKNEHFVPQSYLKFFANLRNTKKNIYQTIVFDKVNNTFYSQNVDKVAAEGKFFHFPEEINVDANIKEMIKYMNDNQFIEKMFSQDVEIPFKKHLDEVRFLYNVLQNPIGVRAINDDQKINLSVLIAIQMLRTKSFREQTSQAQNKIAQSLVDIFMEKEDPNYQIGDVKAKFGEKSSMALQASMLFDEDVLNSFAESLYNHIWLIYVNKTSEPFITSDNPVVKIPHKQSDYMSYGGIKSEGIEILFPISTKLVIGMYERKYHKQLEVLENTFAGPLEKENVDYCNSIQILQANRQVFSNNRNFEVLLNKLRKKYPDLLEIKPQLEVFHNGKVY